MSVVSRRQYQRDIGAAAECINDLYEQVLSLADDYGTSPESRQRHRYAADLEGLRREGFHVDPWAELADLDAIDGEYSRERFVASRTAEIRRFYQKSPRPEGYSESCRPRVSNARDVQRIVAHATQHGCSFEDACRALGV